MLGVTLGLSKGQGEPRWRLRSVVHECVVQAMTDRTLERLVQDAAPVHAIEPSQLGFELPYVPLRPLLHD
jgi:hypothetical protein